MCALVEQIKYKFFKSSVVCNGNETGSCLKLD